MKACEEFVRDINLPWVRELIVLCDVCIYSVGHKDCKINGINNETAIVHKPFYGNSKVVRVFK